MLQAINVLLASLGFIFWTALIDADHILKQQYILDKTTRFAQRATFFIVIACFNLQLFLAASLLFIALFDQAINLCCKKPLFYLGTTAKWDIFWKKHIRWYILLKIITLISSVILFFS